MTHVVLCSRLCRINLCIHKGYMKIQSSTRNLLNSNPLLSVVSSTQPQSPGDFQAFLTLLYFPFLLPLPLSASLPGQLKQPPNWSLVMNLVQLNLVLPPFPCQSRSIQGYLTCKPKLFIDTLLPTIHNPESLPWSKGLAKLGFNYFSCPSPPHELSCNPN